MEKEYVVVLNKDVDYDQFWNEIENESDIDGFVPSRRVDIVNERPGSLRSCHYSLTDNEATKLKNDPRVFAVELPPEHRKSLKIVKTAAQQGNFTKLTSEFVGTGDFVNWGLRRCISATNPYGTGTSVTGDYTYNLDGTGVDVVITDSGLQVNHPEFTDSAGVSRVQQINWYTASGGIISGIQSPNFYRDFDGHGTHVAGIAAGKNYGWAKNSRIYSLKIAGLEGLGDEDTGIPPLEALDLIRLWHLNKAVDPSTGVRRPTVVNMSWNYISAFANIDGGLYRGQIWSGTSRRTDFGMIGFNGGDGFYYFNARVAAVDVGIEELIDAGIHVCISAGNAYQKIDIVDGIDYDNFFNGLELDQNLNLVPAIYYYHRGGSPFSSEAINVGSSDSLVFNATTEQKSEFSNCGPGVDLYAPGSNIRSATSNTNMFGGIVGNYYLNSNFKQMTISGTSMASPQVCGLGALYLQLNPKLTPAQLKSRILTDAQSTVYTTGLNNDYTNFRSISQGSPAFLFNKYNAEKPFDISGGIGISSGSLTLK